MKQKLYITGLVSAIIVFTGAILKVNHMPGASILMTLGIATLVLVFLPAALLNLSRTDVNPGRKPLYIVTYITCFVVFTGMLFKLQHWPFAGLLLTIALPFPYVIFLPVFLKVTSKEPNFNIYNTVFVLMLLAVNSVFSGLLAINVTRDRIIESYNISRNYIGQARLLADFPVINGSSDLNIKIDELVKIADNYQLILLQSEDKTMKDWQEHPENLIQPTRAGFSLYLLVKAGEPEAELRLEKGLKELSGMLKQNKNTTELAAIAPALFDLQSTGDADDWGVRTFSDNNLAWSLIYLDGLKSQLCTIKALCE
jgi:hypothetical protein